MRYHSLLVMFCPCMWVSLSYGQFHLEKDRALYIGPKANYQVAGIAKQNNHGQNEMDYLLNFGYGAGVALTYRWNAKSSILAEASYQTGGQKYRDRFRGKLFDKTLAFELLSIPVVFRHIISDVPAGYAGIGTESKPLWYVAGGLQINHLLSADAKWKIDHTETDFLTFVLDGDNPHDQRIRNMGAPVEVEDLFTAWDLVFVTAGGVQINLPAAIILTLELRGGIGITDINAPDWRLANKQNVYKPSRNVFFGIHAGVHYTIFRPG